MSKDYYPASAPSSSVFKPMISFNILCCEELVLQVEVNKCNKRCNALPAPVFSANR